MNECLGSGLGECGTEAGNVAEMKEGSFGDVIDMGLEGKFGIHDDTEVTDFGRGGDDGVVDVQGEVDGGAGEGIWTNDDYFRFVTVEFEKVVLHPVFYFSQAGGEGGVGGSSDGFRWEVQLCVIGVAVKVEAMAAEDLTEGEDVNDEEEGAKHGALGNTVGNRGGGGFAVIY